MKNDEKIKLKEIKEKLAKKPTFKSRCKICHCKQHKRGMTFHHRWYLKNEKSHKNFTNPLEYYQYVRPLICDQPKRFSYLCNSCHQAVTKLHRWKPIKRNRLIKEVRATRYE